MPANLSQQYRNAEKEYRRASTLEEELACLEWMLREIPKHKGTDKLQADLKKRISRTRAKLQHPSPSRSGPGFRLPHQGAARVVLLGGPNSGKSTLFNALTDSQTAVADYPYTTTQPQPSLMTWQDIKVQLVDTPPVNAETLDPRTASLIRGADLVLLMIRVDQDFGVDYFADAFGTFEKSRTRLGLENRIDESDIGVTYTKTILVWNASEDPDFEERRGFAADYLSEFLPTRLGWQGLRLDTPASGHLSSATISAVRPSGLDELRNLILQKLDLIRVFTKNPAETEPDLRDPVALPRGSTVLDLAGELHEDLVRHFHHARIWGSGKHAGTVVSGDYELADHDIVEIRTR